MGGTQIEGACVEYWSILHVEMCEAFDWDLWGHIRQMSAKTDCS